MPTLSTQETNKLRSFYTAQLNFFRNVAGMKTNWAWIGEGTDPLNYMLTLNKDKDDSEASATSIRSVLTITGIIAKVEYNRYKMVIHLCGKDTNLKQGNFGNFWDSQYLGLMKAIEAAPQVNNKTYEASHSEQTIAFKINRETKEKVPVVNAEDTIMDGDIPDNVVEGSLVVVEFIPYMWSLMERTGMSLTVQRIKIIKSGHVGTASLEETKRKAADIISSPAKKAKIVIASTDDAPSTSNLGF